jgi:hypothetical protein
VLRLPFKWITSSATSHPLAGEPCKGVTEKKKKKEEKYKRERERENKGKWVSK